MIKSKYFFKIAFEIHYLKNDKFLTFFLKEGLNFIGSDYEKCDIILNFPEIENIHFLINMNKKLIEIESFSKNNTLYYNGNRELKKIMINDIENEKYFEFFTKNLDFKIYYFDENNEAFDFEKEGYYSNFDKELKRKKNIFNKKKNEFKEKYLFFGTNKTKIVFSFLFI